PLLSAATTWARHRDMQKNVFWSFEPGSDTLQKFADILKTWTHCMVEVDAEAAKASGLTLESPLPGVVIGGPITLRSLDELLLAPHGLGVRPAAGEKKLVITWRPATAETQSYLQKLRARALNDR